MRSNVKRVVFLMFVMVLCLMFVTGCGWLNSESGPATTAIKAFFKNWEFKRYTQMHEQTVNSRDKNNFIEQMEKTPITWKNISVLSEKKVKEDSWDVEVSLEVTDVKTAFAACILNLKHAPADIFRQRNFSVTPADMGIEKFMPIKQTWRVIKLDDKYLIDVRADGSIKNRHENILNYVLDAGSIGFLNTNAKMQELSAAAWLAMAAANLDFSVERASQIMLESQPLIAQGEQNLLRLFNKLDSLVKM